MTHILQIAFDFDDEAITKKVEATCAAAVVANVQKKVEREIFAPAPFYSKDERSGLTDFAAARVDNFMETHKDEIISLAAERLADRLARTKAGKAAIEQAASR